MANMRKIPNAAAKQKIQLVTVSSQVQSYRTLTGERASSSLAIASD